MTVPSDLPEVWAEKVGSMKIVFECSKLWSVMACDMLNPKQASWSHLFLPWSYPQPPSSCISTIHPIANKMVTSLLYFTLPHRFHMDSIWIPSRKYFNLQFHLESIWTPHGLHPVLHHAPLIPAGMNPFHWNPQESAGMGRNPQEWTGMALEWTKMDILEIRV